MYATRPWPVYHALNPHPALSPIPNPNDPDACAEQSANETLYFQLLVQGVLAVLLPTEDLENDCLRTLVGDGIADLVEDGVSGILVPPGEPELLAAATGSVLDDPVRGTALGAAASLRAETYSDRRSASAFAEILDDVATGTGAPVPTRARATGP